MFVYVDEPEIVEQERRPSPVRGLSFKNTDEQNKENMPLNRPRGILKKTTTSALGQSATTGKESRRTKNAVSFKNVPMSQAQINAEKMKNQLLDCKIAILTVWGRHQARCATAHNYIPRLPIVFQPGMTAKYVQFILELPLDEDLTDGTLTENQQVKFKKFSQEFKNCEIDVVKTKDDLSLKAKSANIPRVLIIEGLNVTDIGLIRDPTIINSKLCIILLTKPIVGLNLAAFEKSLKVKARPINLPRLTVKPDLDSQYLQFDDRNYSVLAGIPKLLEENGLTTENEKDAAYSIVRELALWRKPEYKQYDHYFYTLFYYALSSADIYPYTLLDVEHSRTSVLDAALALGFEAVPSKLVRKQTDSQENTPSIEQLLPDVTTPKVNNSQLLPKFTNFTAYTLVCNKAVKEEFHGENRRFEYFTVVAKDSLRWYEAEKAIARAMSSYSEDDRTRPLASRFSFFEKSFIAELCPVISLLPTILPKVTSKGSDLDNETLTDWTTTDMVAPPKPTMKKSEWHKLLTRVPKRRSLLNIERSKAPDYSVLLDATHLLCFQAKTGLQDSSVEKLKEEVSKSPYLDIKNGKLEREHAEVFITFVFVSMVHKKLKESLIREQENAKKTNNTNQISTDKKKSDYQNFPNEIEVYDSHIYIQPGCAVLPLPENVEVIILRKSGLQRLFGIEGYETLENPQSDIEALVVENQIRVESLKKPTLGELSDDEFFSEARDFLSNALERPNGEKMIKNLLKELRKEKKDKAKKNKK